MKHFWLQIMLQHKKIPIYLARQIYGHTTLYIIFEEKNIYLCKRMHYF